MNLIFPPTKKMHWVSPYYFIFFTKDKNDTWNEVVLSSHIIAFHMIISNQDSCQETRQTAKELGNSWQQNWGCHVNLQRKENPSVPLIHQGQCFVEGKKMQQHWNTCVERAPANRHLIWSDPCQLFALLWEHPQSVSYWNWQLNTPSEDIYYPDSYYQPWYHKISLHIKIIIYKSIAEA